MIILFFEPLQEGYMIFHIKFMKYTFDTLKNYGLWYYFRYFPSSKKLLEKLYEKSKDREVSQKVFENISYLIDEKQVIWDKIRLYLMRNKNLRYIIQKLWEKWFEKTLVQEILENDFLEEWKSLLQESSLRIKIENYKNAWKSLQYIKQKLIERPEDREIIESIIATVFENWEDENLKKEWEKLQNKWLERQKIIQKLLQKWFFYDDIKKLM